MRVLLGLLNAKQNFELIAHLRRNFPFGLAHGQKFGTVDGVFLLPLQDSVKIGTFPIDAEVGERMGLSLNPVERDDVDVGVAHYVLQQDVNTMVRVYAMQRTRFAFRIFLAKVVGKVHIATEGVKAVDLVQDVQLRNVGVRAKTEVVRVFGHYGGIFAESENIGFGDGGGVEVPKALARRVDFGGRGLAVNGVVGFEEGTVHLFCAQGKKYTFMHGRFVRLAGNYWTE